MNNHPQDATGVPARAWNPDARPSPLTATFPPLARPSPLAATFPPLADEHREFIPTDQAAHYLLRRPQTMREWSCLGSGLLKPVKVGNRLGWRTADIRRLLGVTE